eukprot:COSAG01_NODE_22443_length_855_cov_1.486772_1_plen_145_part_01
MEGPEPEPEEDQAPMGVTEPTVEPIPAPDGTADADANPEAVMLTSMTGLDLETCELILAAARKDFNLAASRAFKEAQRRQRRRLRQGGDGTTVGAGGGTEEGEDVEELAPGERESFTITVLGGDKISYPRTCGQPSQPASPPYPQ